MRGPQPRTLVEIPVLSAQVVEKGDFVLIWQGNAITPSGLGSIYAQPTTARRDARMIYAGVARMSSANGQTAPVQVDVSLESIFAFEQCSAHAASVADLYGICAVSTAGGLWGLADDTVEPDCSYPIAVLVQQKLALGTRMLCKQLPGKLFNVEHSYNLCPADVDMSFAG
jgi:hypothetical protein